MAIPKEWHFKYLFNGETFVRIDDARGVCPYCHIATTFQVRFAAHDTKDGFVHLYILLSCNYAACRRTVYVETTTRISGGPKNCQSIDPFFVHPGGSIDPAHPSVPAVIAEDWLEAQRSLVGGNPKAAAVMLRRVLYGVLIDKGCSLKPLKSGVEQLITSQRLPAVFDNWLPAIQDDGHDAAHPDRALTVEQENVSETLEYTAELLRYLYVEPYEFQLRKTRNNLPASPASK